MLTPTALPQTAPPPLCRAQLQRAHRRGFWLGRADLAIRLTIHKSFFVELDRPLVAPLTRVVFRDLAADLGSELLLRRDPVGLLQLHPFQNLGLHIARLEEKQRGGGKMKRCRARTRCRRNLRTAVGRMVDCQVTKPFTRYSFLNYLLSLCLLSQTMPYTLAIVHQKSISKLLLTNLLVVY